MASADLPFPTLMRSIFAILILFTSLCSAEDTITTLRVLPHEQLQVLDGMGCGAIFYEGHITSLAARGKTAEQEQLYDDMFTKVRTDFLHLMIRHDHEPENDNADPYDPQFKDEWFGYARKTLAICKAAKKRQPSMKLYATLYSPPVWMKTNGEVSAGGKKRGTLKPNLELEFAEFCWAFLEWMQRHGQPIDYLSIVNEPDWPHTQPGCCFTPEQHAALFAKVATYLDTMAEKFPAVPRVKLVAPNVLSAVSCAEKWLPPLFASSPDAVDVIGAHDYDRRGDRWRTLSDMAGGRPVWLTEWCVNGADASPGLYNSASQYWLAMTEAFNGGANAWMAYDWVYPPRQGGEALIHLNWGKDYTFTKIYHGYRQWCAPLVPGMKVVKTQLTGPFATDISKPGLKATAFVSPDGKRLAIHAAAVGDKDIPLHLEIVHPESAPYPALQTYRTSTTEDVALLPPTDLKDNSVTITVPAGGMMTWLAGYPEEL
jgi:O-glycosyl hydrolase